jgi:hypothetical protein
MSFLSGSSLIAVLAVCMTGVGQADANAPDSQPDKSGYTLFKPTPVSQLRDLNSDRPSVTTGPYTVDAGHFQIESSFLEFTHDYNQGRHADTLDVFPTNVRVGVLSNVELDVSVDPYENVVDYTRPSSSRSEGFGNMGLQAKLNFWGDDGGPTAFGLIPFAKFPTGAAGISNHHLEGGLILPFSVTITDGLSIAGMAEFDVARNAGNTGYGVDAIDTIVLTKSLTKEISVYLEYVGDAPINEGRTFAVSVDAGGAFQVNDNLQFDAGINVGISKSLPNFIVFSGITLRL